MKKRVRSATEEMAFLVLALLLLMAFLWQNHHILYDNSTQANHRIESLEQTTEDVAMGEAAARD